MLHLRFFSGLVLFTIIYGGNAFAGRDAGEAFQRYFSEALPSGLSSLQSSPATIDWSQPPLGCTEDMVPHPSFDRKCLNLTQVANPLSDWPTNLSPADQQYWYAQRRALSYCRAEEVLRREAAQPGSQSAGAIETSWMIDQSIQHYQDKVNAIYRAEALYGVPVYVLTGAVYQESLFAELGISEDGGNYSCGVEQINLEGWCSWANTQSATNKRAIGWPTINVNCDDPNILTLSFIKPFYDIAVTRLNGLPEYQLNKSQFQNISLTDVEGQWPAATDDIQNLRYQLVESFINFCSDPTYGILSKAHDLETLYRGFVSNAFQNKDRYMANDRFHLQCERTPTGDAFPLHTGWLMAVAAYNAGPRAIEAVGFYNNWTKATFNNPHVVAGFTPDQIIESIYWAGKYNPVTDNIDYRNWNDNPLSWIWYTGCVAQRHVARVMQNVTRLPEFFVDSLEGEYPCAKSVFVNGKLVQSAVPPFRQTSSGVKDRTSLGR